MEQKQVEALIGELEMRLERLRQLYDQYFLGFEKLEPTVARKDVERRIETLRKEQIRNTAMRFRFNVITQKYNTYSTFWLRTCRQIEEGTYKRHVQRANQRFGNAAPRRKGAESELDLDIDVDLAELEAEVERDLASMADEAHDTVPPRRGARPAADDEDDDALETLRPPPSTQEPAQAIPRQPPAPTFAAESPSNVVRRDGPMLPDRPIRPAAIPVGGQGRRVALRRAGDGRDLPPDSVRSAVRAAPGSEELAGASGPSTDRTPSPEPAPDTEKPPAPAPRVEARTARPSQGGAARATRAAAQAPSAHGRAKGGEKDLSDDRMRQLYAEYIRAKRSRKEPTSAITFDALAKSLRDSSAKLREQHGGKNVDFEVAEKDGKTILRPVVK